MITYYDSTSCPWCTSHVLSTNIYLYDMYLYIWGLLCSSLKPFGQMPLVVLMPAGLADGASEPGADRVAVDALLGAKLECTFG